MVHGAAGFVGGFTIGKSIAEAALADLGFFVDTSGREKAESKRCENYIFHQIPLNQAVLSRASGRTSITRDRVSKYLTRLVFEFMLRASPSNEKLRAGRTPDH